MTDPKIVRRLLLDLESLIRELEIDKQVGQVYISSGHGTV